jgi:hypothetical protein
VDRNPQTFVPNIFKARESDFRPATERIAVTGPATSRLELTILSKR